MYQDVEHDQQQCQRQTNEGGESLHQRAIRSGSGTARRGNGARNYTV
jgi:hypothetical protein